MMINIMKKASFAVILCAIAGCLFVSCGQSTNGAKTDVDTTRYALASEQGPGYDEARTLPATEIDYGGKHYVINVSIAPCDSLPLVKDSYDDPYLDNTVKVVVTADGNTVVNRSFVKRDFAAAAGSLSLDRLVLGGLAFNTINSTGISFGAQLNEPGDIEGGQLFKVTIPLAGGQPIIVRDTNVEDLGSSYVD